MSILAPASVNLARNSTDFLLPFLRLPALRFCLGMTATDGATMYTEDIGAREWSINGGVTFASDAVGLPVATFNGSTGYLSAADAGWNSPTGTFTLMAVVSATAAVGMRILSKEPGGTNRAYELLYNVSTATTLTFSVSLDGTIGNTVAVNLAAGAPANGTNFIVARYRAGTQLALWGNGAVATNSTSVPAACFDATGAVNIGRRTAGTDYLNGAIYMLAMCGADIASDHITLLQNHVGKFGINT